MFIFYYHLLKCSFCDFCVSVTTGKGLNQAAAPCLPCMAFPHAQLPQQQGLGPSDYHPQRKPTSGEVLGEGCPSVGNVLGRSPFATSLVAHTVPAVFPWGAEEWEGQGQANQHRECSAFLHQSGSKMHMSKSPRRRCQDCRRSDHQMRSVLQCGVVISRNPLDILDIMNDDGGAGHCPHRNLSLESENC